MVVSRRNRSSLLLPNNAAPDSSGKSAPGPKRKNTGGPKCKTTRTRKEPKQKRKSAPKFVSEHIIDPWDQAKWGYPIEKFYDLVRQADQAEEARCLKLGIPFQMKSIMDPCRNQERLRYYQKAFPPGYLELVRASKMQAAPVAEPQPTTSRDSRPPPPVIDLCDDDSMSMPSNDDTPGPIDKKPKLSELRDALQDSSNQRSILMPPNNASQDLSLQESIPLQPDDATQDSTSDDKVPEPPANTSEPLLPEIRPSDPPVINREPPQADTRAPDIQVDEPESSRGCKRQRDESEGDSTQVNKVIKTLGLAHIDQSIGYIRAELEKLIALREKLTDNK